MEIETATNLQLTEFPRSAGGMEGYYLYWEKRTRRAVIDDEDLDDESQRLFRTVLLAVKED